MILLVVPPISRTNRLMQSLNPKSWFTIHIPGCVRRGGRRRDGRQWRLAWGREGREWGWALDKCKMPKLNQSGSYLLGVFTLNHDSADHALLLEELGRNFSERFTQTPTPSVSLNVESVTEPGNYTTIHTGRLFASAGLNLYIFFFFSKKKETFSPCWF